MNVKPYNGYTNYETWLVDLWIGNDEGSQSYWQDQAEEVWKEAEASEYSTREQEATRTLAEAMKDEIEGMNPLTGSGMFDDLLGAALSEVDWDDIAENFVAEVDKEEETEPEEIE